SIAVIVRLFKAPTVGAAPAPGTPAPGTPAPGTPPAPAGAAPTPPSGVPAGTAWVSTTNLNLAAASPGRWGNTLFVKVTNDGINDLADADVARLKSTKANLFNLEVYSASPEAPADPARATLAEKFAAVSNEGESLRRIDLVVNAGSALVRVPAKPAS